MDIIRSFDPTLMESACADFNGKNFDYKEWLDNHLNCMYVVSNSDGDNVGLATFTYPGVYTAHWFFKSRGKESLDIIFAMADKLFKEFDVQTIRGLTPEGLKGARYLAKQVGFVSMGFEEFYDGMNEIMCLTRQAFYQKQKERDGRSR